MLPMANYGNASANIPGPFTVNTPAANGGASTILLWIPTARDNTTQSGTGGISDTATRTSTTCFMKGLKETIEIQTNTGVAWQWRRICFTSKDPSATFANALPNSYQGYTETSDGYVRQCQTLTTKNTTDAAQLNQLRNVLFRGALGIDWSDYNTAPIDTNRVSLKYDKTQIIRSGNDTGVLRRQSIWHPMNKNLVYDDDEVGGNNLDVVYSTGGKAGMGDYYVVDIFTAGASATAGTDKLLFAPQATLYWHEK